MAVPRCGVRAWRLCAVCGIDRRPLAARVDRPLATSHRDTTGHITLACPRPKVRMAVVLVPRGTRHDLLACARCSSMQEEHWSCYATLVGTASFSKQTNVFDFRTTEIARGPAFAGCGRGPVCPRAFNIKRERIGGVHDLISHNTTKIPKSTDQSASTVLSTPKQRTDGGPAVVVG